MDTNLEPGPVNSYDPIDPGVMQCPYPFYKALQRDAPVYEVPEAGYYIVSRYQDVYEALRKHEVFSSDLTQLFPTMAGVFVPTPVLNFADPPLHGRTKSIAVRAFGPGRVNALDEAIRKIVDHLIDSFIDMGEVELLEAFALPLPMTVIAGQLGIPTEDLERFKVWSSEMLVFHDPASRPEDFERAVRSIREANAYFMQKFYEKQAHPTEDVISTLATASLEQDSEGAAGSEKPNPLSEDEVLSMIQLLLVGGNETTTNAILNGMLMLMQDPGLVEDLRAGRAAWEPTIEEFLRLESPVRGFWRLTTCETELAGVTIPKGKAVFLSFAAANRDAEHFPNPECLDPSRVNVNTHLAFGQGIHLCVGFRLARKELGIAFQRLFERLENIRLTPGKNDLDNIFVPTALVRGLKSLHLSFDRASH